MVRGTPGQKRRHCVSVRLTEEELERWHRAREKTGRRELGAWVRAVVEQRLGRKGIPGDVPTVPLVNAAAYGQLVAAANNLNQLTRYTHERRELAAAIEAAVAEVGRAAMAVRGLTTPSDDEEPDDDEHQDHGADR
jgi:hypothetical protein